MTWKHWSRTLPLHIAFYWSQYKGIDSLPSAPIPFLSAVSIMIHVGSIHQYPAALLSLCLLSSVLARLSAIIRRCSHSVFFFFLFFTSHMFCSNESYTCYWKSHNNINLCRCPIRLVTHAYHSSNQGECMAVFLKMDGKCVGCALGVVYTYFPEDVRMQICIDCLLRPRGGDAGF